MPGAPQVDVTSSTAHFSSQSGPNGLSAREAFLPSLHDPGDQRGALRQCHVTPGTEKTQPVCKEHFPDIPVDVVLGGYHLAGKAMEPRIEPTVRDLEARQVATVPRR